MYTLKLIARRGTALGAAFALLVAAVVPVAPAFADALNPLTERSLLLSSSAPGYQNTDGSGNPLYAPPGSGPNGQKSGETFTFKVSSTDTVKGLSFQYCTTAAGSCRAPGNNDGDADPNNDGNVADSTRDANVFPRAAGDETESDLDVVGTFTQGTGDGQFQVYVNGTPSAATWAMTAVRAESTAWIDGATQPEQGLTGKKNYIILTSATGQLINATDEVQVIFKASTGVYITNPGYGSFFVKINTYDTDDYADAASTDGDTGNGSQGYTHITPLDTNSHVIDGGVTVANVMTDSIHIVTKVLETMSFSVGIQNPDTTDKDAPASHGTCSPISQTNTITGLNNNRLNLGNPNAEYSLETGKAWDVYSYWRLSSNSSGGATVYYSGDTLRNTSGDFIAESGATAKTSLPGTEQFGLAFVDATNDDIGYWKVGDSKNTSDSDNDFYRWDDADTDGVQDTGERSGLVVSDPDNYRLPSLYVLNEETPYASGSGTIDNGSGGAGTAAFAFKATSSTVPELLAANNTDVISCDTAKMRYVGNIAADTPAGVYTTKINYLAAPQY